MKDFRGEWGRIDVGETENPALHLSELCFFCAAPRNYLNAATLRARGDALQKCGTLSATPSAMPGIDFGETLRCCGKISGISAPPLQSPVSVDTQRELPAGLSDTTGNDYIEQSVIY